jgi:hypothetical protein
MGLPWIELHTTLPTHPKSLRLARLLGKRMAWAHMAQLWLWCADHCQDGRFAAEDVDVLESAAGWEGERGAFAMAAVKAGFLEDDGGDFVARSWVERAAAHLAKRERDSARQRERYARTSQRFSAKKKAVSMSSPPESARRTDGGSSGLSGNSNTNPNPNPNSLPTEDKDSCRMVFEHWRVTMGKSARVVLDSKRRAKVEARLAEGYSVEDLNLAVDGCRLTPHNMGQNDRGERYDDIELICRDAAHVDRFIANANAPPKPKPKANPFARATDDDKFRPGYVPPLDANGDVDFSAGAA